MEAIIGYPSYWDASIFFFFTLPFYHSDLRLTNARIDLNGKINLTLMSFGY